VAEGFRRAGRNRRCVGADRKRPAASQEQSTGIEEINKALNQMDEATQQNSALVEENAASAKTLEQQSEMMNEKVAFFRLEEHGTPVAASTGRTAARSAVPRDGAGRTHAGEARRRIGAG
jgi:methyl-accepting chemotaxis protein